MEKKQEGQGRGHELIWGGFMGVQSCKYGELWICRARVHRAQAHRAQFVNLYITMYTSHTMVHLYTSHMQCWGHRAIGSARRCGRAQRP